MMGIGTDDMCILWEGMSKRDVANSIETVLINTLTDLMAFAGVFFVGNSNLSGFSCFGIILVLVITFISLNTDISNMKTQLDKTFAIDNKYSLLTSVISVSLVTYSARMVSLLQVTPCPIENAFSMKSNVGRALRCLTSMKDVQGAFVETRMLSLFNHSLYNMRNVDDHCRCLDLFDEDSIDCWTQRLNLNYTRIRLRDSYFDIFNPGDLGGVMWTQGITERNVVSTFPFMLALSLCFVCFSASLGLEKNSDRLKVCFCTLTSSFVSFGFSLLADPCFSASHVAGIMVSVGFVSNYAIHAVRSDVEAIKSITASAFTTLVSVLCMWSSYLSFPNVLSMSIGSSVLYSWSFACTISINKQNVYSEAGV
jgi:hypothetical protein